jgi:hypothetical protein
VNALTRRRSSRRVIPTSSTGTTISSFTATVEASRRRRSRRQTQLPPIEMREAQLDDSDEFDDVYADDGALSVTSWENRLRELAEYRKIHGHCNVPRGYSENTKLATWVSTQRKHYKLRLEGKKSQITLPRIQEPKSLGFEWRICVIWEDRLSELADYGNIHGHCNVPYRYSKNTKLGIWMSTQRKHYKLRLEGNESQMTLPRIQELESLSFEWVERLSELAEYRKTHGHCNVPLRYRENTQLANWVRWQKLNYRWLEEGKPSPALSASRIQALESLGFKWTASTPKTGKNV